jgi:aryl-alcohol dehydrogenase-like predicted oxidoreductase
MMTYTHLTAPFPAISRISLGSWNTFSRLKFEDGMALVRKALDLGINFFDVGYYWDKPHTEIIFGRILQVLAPPRDAYLLAEKLWLWDYPAQSFKSQLQQALIRLAVDYVDLVMVSRPTPETDFNSFCEEIAALVDLGLARGWGATNWEPEEIRRAHVYLGERGKAQPLLVQLQYNLARRAIVEGTEYTRLFAETGIRLCAAHTMEGGILAGHLDRDRVDPSAAAQGKVPVDRNIARDAGGIRDRIRTNYPILEEIANRFKATPAQIAIAAVLANKATATALIGVTRESDLEDNIGAIKLLDRREELLAAIAPLAIDSVAHPRLFDPVKNE